MAASNAFMSGFTGGMTSINSMMDSAEQRRTRREDRDNQQALQYFSAINHGYQGMNDEQKQEFQASVVDRMNGDPAIQQILSRNVGHNEQKRISPQFGKMTKDGFVPVIDVVDGRTGEVIRTGPLTEFGNSDGSDKPVAIGNEDFMTMMGSYLGKDDFGRQMELEIISRGGQLPEKAEQMNPYDWGKPFNTFTQEGKRVEEYYAPGGRVMAKVRGNPDDPSDFEVFDITDRQNPKRAGDGSVDDQFARSFLADTNTNPADEGAGGNTPGLGVLLPDHLPAGMQPGKSESSDEVTTEENSKSSRFSDEGLFELTDKRNISNIGNPYLQDEEVRQRYKDQRNKAIQERPEKERKIAEARKRSREERESRNKRRSENMSNIRYNRGIEG